MERSDIVLYHRWSSRADLAALDLVRQELARRGLVFSTVSMPDHRKQCMAQALDGLPLRLMKMHGQELLAWGRETSLLADLSVPMRRGGWGAALSTAVRPFMQVGDRLHGVPVALHKSNCAWFSQAAFQQVGLASPPDNWPAFNAVAERLMAAGIAPLALGGQDWQVCNLFENVVLGLAGADFYRRAFGGQDSAILAGAEMHAVFRQMRLLSTMVDGDYLGRSWEDTAALVAEARAGMQVMGDWARHPFAAPLREGDVLYADAPGTQGCFVFIADFFALFATHGEQVALEALADVLMDAQFQRRFSAAKGALPARMDLLPEPGDRLTCSIQASHRQAVDGGAMLGSLTYQQAAPDHVLDAILPTVYSHFTTSMRDADAVQALASNVHAACAGRAATYSTS